MESQLKTVNVKLLTDNVFKLLDNDWMLITAGNQESFNSMTASWGAFGILWNKPIAIGFIRPQRYTFEFMNKSESFTLSFFNNEHRPALNFLGSHSGRTVNKMTDSGLTPVFTERNNVYFEEARLVLDCKIMYTDDLKQENFISKTLVKDIYPKQDFHRMFIGEITNCLCSDKLTIEKFRKMTGADENSF